MSRLGCLLLIFMSICRVIPADAQNLVRNGSFEAITACPIGWGVSKTTCVSLATPWFCTAPVCHEIELLHGCDTVYHWGVPNNMYAINQYAYHGNAYTVLLLFNHTIGGRGELIQTELLTPLIKDSLYCVDFYVIIAPRHSNYAIQQIEVYFTYDTLMQSPITFTFPDTPAVDIKTGFLNDTLNWSRISTTYTAKGGERFFSVGTKAYKPMISESFSHSTQYNPIIGNSSHYFFDAISVYPCNAPVDSANAGEDRLLCLGDTTELGTHDLEQYEYLWFLPGNTADTLSKQARFRVAPTKTTTYVLQVTDFKFTTSWDTVTVTVEECGSLAMTIYPNPTTDKATFAFNRPIPKNVELRIYDMAGKLVSIHPLHPEVEEREFSVNIIQLAKGVYTCRVAFGETESATGKLVVYR